MKVSLWGYGTVGQGVADILGSHPEWGIEVASVLVRDPARLRDVAAPAPFVTSRDEALDGVDVVLEATGEVEENARILLPALASGVHVVTANKALVSAHLEEFLAAEAAGAGELRFEAAVAAGIPVVAETLSQRRTGAITRVEGIINGSCNFILSAMAAGRSYSDAAAEATRLGYLEADPTADVGGFDAMRKLRILASLAFRRPVLERDISCEGIDDVTERDVADAASRGEVIKQIACAEIVEGAVSASVRPVAVAASSFLGGVSGATNAVGLHHEHLGVLALVGPGAGRYETANAMVTDLLDVAGVR